MRISCTEPSKKDNPALWIVPARRATLRSMIMTDKEALRRQLIDKRRMQPTEEAKTKSTSVVEAVRSLEQWESAREVLLYWPIKGEVDVRPLIHELWERDVRVLLPRCRPNEFGSMDIACATCQDELTPGPFSIMEPDSEKCAPEGEVCPDMALIPGVGFDWRGFRLGFGGGYYDRILATGGMKKALIVGVGYGFQLVDQLPVEEWDQPVNIICTEEEVWQP